MLSTRSPATSTGVAAFALGSDISNARTGRNTSSYLDDPCRDRGGERREQQRPSFVRRQRQRPSLGACLHRSCRGYGRDTTGSFRWVMCPFTATQACVLGVSLVLWGGAKEVYGRKRIDVAGTSSVEGRRGPLRWLERTSTPEICLCLLPIEQLSSLHGVWVCPRLSPGVSQAAPSGNNMPDSPAQNRAELGGSERYISHVGVAESRSCVTGGSLVCGSLPCACRFVCRSPLYPWKDGDVLASRLF